MIAARVTIEGAAESYCLERALSRGSEYLFRLSVRQFSKFVKLQWLDEVTDDDISRWVRWLTEKYAPLTAKNRRGDVLSLMRFAGEKGWAGEVRRVRPVKVPKPQPRSLKPVDLALLVGCAKKIRGRYPNNLPRAAVVEAWILGQSDSALRRSDMLRLEWSMIAGDGSGVITQQKTGDAVAFRLRPETVEAMRRVSKTGKVFPVKKAWIQRSLRKLMDSLGLLGEGKRKRVTHKLRCTSITLYEKENPGLGPAHAGNKTPAVTYRYYIDPTVAYGERPLPPRIE